MGPFFTERSRISHVNTIFLLVLRLKKTLAGRIFELLIHKSHMFKCIFLGSTTITLSYSDRIFVASGSYEMFEIEVFTQNVQLECNRDHCMWTQIDSFGISTVVGMNRTYTIPYITIETDRIYVLKLRDNTGVFVPMVRIQITPIGM